MICEDLKESYELYALGLLDGEEKNEIDAHLARGCATCWKSLESAMVLNAAILACAPDAAPSRRLRRRILNAVGVQHQGSVWAAAFVALCMLVLALWFGVQEHRRANELAAARQELLQSNAQRDRLQQALSFLDDPATLPVGFGKGAATPPRGNVFLHPRLGVLLIASNLPPAQNGKIYEMWMIPKVGAPRPAGLFQSDASGHALYILPGPVDASALGAIAVTVEPQAGSPAPTTQPIIAAPIAGS